MQEICQSGSGGGAVLSRLYLIRASEWLAEASVDSPRFNVEMA